MSRSIGLTTPKTLTNRSPLDIDELTLSSLDLSGGTLNLSGTTVIGTANNFSSLSINSDTVNSDTINVNFIRELTPGNQLAIRNTTQDVQITGLQEVSLISTGFATVLSVRDNIQLSTTSTGGGGAKIQLLTGGLFSNFQTEFVEETIYQRGGSLFNAISQNPGENTFEVKTPKRIITGSFYDSVNLAPGSENNVLIPFGVFFLTIPIVICTVHTTTSGGDICVTVSNITTNSFVAATINVGPLIANDIVIQWIAIGGE
jgi:hypothetical protein